MKLLNMQTITIFLIGLIFSGTIVSCNQKKKENQSIIDDKTISITGTILGSVNGNTISLTEINADFDDESIDTITTVNLKNGKFSFENLEIDTLRAAKLTFGDTINAIVFLEPGEINIEINPKDTVFTSMFNDIEVRANRTGSINNVLFTEYRNKRHAVLDDPEFIEIKSLDKTMFDMYADFELLNAQMHQFKEKSSKRDPMLNKIKNDFIMEHKDQMVAPYIVLFEDYRFDDAFGATEIITFFDAFDKNLEGNIYYDSIKDYEKRSRNTAVGVTLKDFTLKDRNGKDVALSSLKGKYVLIDFWAYWCKPCVASFPHLEELLKKYKSDNFEVFGISSDPNYEKWIQALDKYKPSWIQVIDTDEKTVSNQFNISKLPTTFLVDPEGKVYAIDLYHEDLDDELAAIFGH